MMTLQPDLQRARSSISGFRELRMLVLRFRGAGGSRAADIQLVSQRCYI